MFVGASSIKHVNTAFVLTRDDLSKLHKILSKNADHIKYEIECSDEVSRTFTDVKKILEYENPPGREIKSLTIRAYTQDYSQDITISFDSSEFSNVHIYIRGPEEDVIKLNRTIEECLQGMRPWYARFAIINFSNTYWIFLPLIISSGFFLPLLPEKLSNMQVYLLIISICLFVVGFLGVLLSILLNLLQRHVFPKAVFAIGQGATRHETREWIRKTIVGGLITTIISLLGGLLWLVASKLTSPWLHQ